MLLLLACKSPEPFPTCSITPPEALPLRSEGRFLKDNADRRVFLRGINTGGRSKFAPYLPFDFEDFDASLSDYLDAAQSWGVTTLRVPFSWAAFEPVQGEYNEGWALQYDALLKEAAARNMWTIVDFHQDIYGEFFCGDGFPRWTVSNPGPDRHDCEDWFFAYLNNDEVAAAFDAFWAEDSEVMAAFEGMWDQMSQRQANRAGVIGFEVINEPGRGNMEEEAWAAEVLTPFYSRMASRIQSKAPDALVFFDSTGLDAVYSTTAVQKPEGQNLVFAPHSYDPSIFMGSGALDASLVAERLEGWYMLGESWDLPVLIGELGGPGEREGITDYARAHFDSLDRLQGHATWWEYSDAEERWNFEDFSLVAPDGTPRESLIDAIVRAYPLALAEEDPAKTSWSWDSASRTLTLSLESIAEGISEIVLPPHFFTGGAMLSGSGGCGEVVGDRLYLKGDGGPLYVNISPITH
jgi:endoglycosylceramidase